MITLLRGLFIFLILEIVDLIELFIEVLCIVIGIPLFVILWFCDKVTHSFDNL